MQEHPNTNAAGLTAALVLLLIYVLHRWFQVDLNDYWKAVATGGAATLRLYIGRDGIKGTALRLWNGAASVWHGKAVAAKK